MYTSEHNLESVRDLFFWNCAQISLLNCLKVTGKLIFFDDPDNSVFTRQEKFLVRENFSRTKRCFNAPHNYLARLVNTNKTKIENTANSDSVTSAKCCYLWTIRVLPSFPFCVKNCLMHKIIVWYFLPPVLLSINL